MTRRLVHLVRAALVAALLCATPAQADRVYQKPDAFVRDAFGGTAPKPGVLWLDEAVKREARAILGHDYPALRLRYWGAAPRTVWVLDEIGKDSPITVGVVVANGRIESLRVLVFRESRGWEVESPAFVRQFDGARLAGDKLDRPIDGIAGATLSVRALTKVARLALALHARVTSAP